MPRYRADRRIAADPTSVALLLTAPASVELWPGARRRESAGGQVLLDVPLPAGPAQVRLHAGAPARAATRFLLHFRGRVVAGAGSPESDFSGLLTLGYDGACTAASLTLDASVDGLDGPAAGFLDRVAEAAERRSRAA